MAMDKFDKKIAIIGGGHIGQALAEGFIKSGKVTGTQIIVASHSLGKLAHLKKHEIELTSDNKIASVKADLIFLAVKPLTIGLVLKEINTVLKRKTVISLAAVVSISDLKNHVENVEIVRIMPNMAIACNQGVIGLFGNGRDKNQIKQLLSVLGSVIEMEKEEDLDSLTLLSGCGPAIVSQFMEMLKNYGIKIGLSSDISLTLVLQTFKGTSAMLEKSKLSPSQLVQSVSTKGGISEAILMTMNDQNLEADFANAMNAGYAKLEKLKESLR